MSWKTSKHSNQQRACVIPEPQLWVGLSRVEELAKAPWWTETQSSHLPSHRREKPVEKFPKYWLQRRGVGEQGGKSWGKERRGVWSRREYFKKPRGSRSVDWEISSRMGCWRCGIIREHRLTLLGDLCSWAVNHSGVWRTSKGPVGCYSEQIAATSQHEGTKQECAVRGWDAECNGGWVLSRPGSLSSDTGAKPGNKGTEQVVGSANKQWTNEVFAHTTPCLWQPCVFHSPVWREKARKCPFIFQHIPLCLHVQTCQIL